MKKCFPLLIAGALLAGIGCEKKTRQTGPVDTSDPNKVMGTLPPPSKANDPTALGGMKTVPGKAPGPKTGP